MASSDGAGFCGVFADSSYFVPTNGLRILPKDFALVPGGDFGPNNNALFHLFYTRQDTLIENRGGHGQGAGLTEKNIGHAISNDLQHWTIVDTAAITARPGLFDGMHVWAPTIVRSGTTYTMFYTGVDAVGEQSIGIATSPDLVHWIQGPAPMLRVSDIPWADPHPDSTGALALYFGVPQLRDPFVLRYPDLQNQWLMYFVAVDRSMTPALAVGVARSTGDLRSWTADPVPLACTEWPYGARIVESPHVFARNGSWWLPYTVNGGPIYFSTSSVSPTDSVSSDWSPHVLLSNVIEGASPLMHYWHGSEYLAINGNEYLAAYNDSTMHIECLQMIPTTAASDSFGAGCASNASVAPAPGSGGGLTLRLARNAPARGAVDFILTLGSAAATRVAVFDLAGRRVRSIADRDLPAGETRLTWDGRNEAGARVGSGMYFVRAVSAGRSRTLNVPLLR
jgi:hypothetical protein